MEALENFDCSKCKGCRSGQSGTIVFSKDEYNILENINNSKFCLIKNKISLASFSSFEKALKMLNQLTP